MTRLQDPRRVQMDHRYMDRRAQGLRKGYRMSIKLPGIAIETR